MLILWLEPPHQTQQGDHIYRTEQPARALGAVSGVSVVSGTLLTPEVHQWMLHADVVINALALDQDLLPLVHQRRRSGKPTVFEINDNFLAVQPWNPTARFLEQPEARSLAFQLAAESDGIQVTTEELRTRFGKYVPQCRVFPNQLWEFPAPQPKPPRLRIGWGGSLGHLEDATWIIPVLRRIIARHPQVDLAIMGDRSLQSLFDWAPPERLIRRLPGTLGEYNTFLSGLHIGLAPLLPTEFNLSRSDVKFLEYASHGVAAVCSALPPYRETVRHRHNGLLFDTLPELEQILETLIQDPAWARRLGNAARSEIQDHRLETLHVHQRMKWLLDLGAGDAEADRGLALPSAPFEGSNYHPVRYGPLEHHLYRGLLQQSDPECSQREFKAAKKIAPHFYLPHLLDGSAETDPRRSVRALTRACQLNDRSCQARYLLARRWELLEQPERATEMYRSCLGVAPNFAPAWMRLGVLAETAGQLEQAVSLYTRAVESNPFHNPARFCLASLAFQGSNLDRAEDYLRKNLALDDGQWSDHYLLGRILAARGNPTSAVHHLERALESGCRPLPVLTELARIHLRQGNTRKARSLLQKAKQSASDPVGRAA